MSLDAGKYRAFPVEATLGMTGTGKEQIAVQFQIVGHENKVTWYGYFTDKTFERTIESLRYCGWEGSELTDFGYDKPLPEGFNKEVELVLDYEDDLEGNPRLKVRWVNGGGGIAVSDPLNAQGAQAFANTMKAKILALDKRKGRKTKSLQAPAPSNDVPLDQQADPF